MVFIHTLLEFTVVVAMEETVLPPSFSSSETSEKALEIPESVDTESTAVPENAFAVRVVDEGTFGGVFEQLLVQNKKYSIIIKLVKSSNNTYITHVLI